MAWPASVLGDWFGVRYPIVQAPLAQITRSELVAAVNGAGALGSLGSSVWAEHEVRQEVARVRERSERPFALNFFVHEPPVEDGATAARMRKRLEGYRKELGAADFPPLSAAPPFGAGMLDLVLELRPALVSFHFGVPEPRAREALRAANIRIFASATTVAEARALEAWGVDAVVAQGYEAGGHRGTFASSFSEASLGTFALVPQVVDAVRVPVIAAGGIADGRGIAAALALGATGVQIGTAFLGCPEATLDPLYRRVLAEPRAAHTRVTTLLSGRPARAIVTRLLEELAAEEGQTPAFPLQRTFTQWLAKAAVAQGNPEFSALWAGQAAPLARTLPAAELVQVLARETEAVLERIALR
jgi:nitronate monooxygenase